MQKVYQDQDNHDQMLYIQPLKHFMLDKTFVIGLTVSR